MFYSIHFDQKSVQYKLRIPLSSCSCTTLRTRNVLSNKEGKRFPHYNALLMRDVLITKQCTKKSGESTLLYVYVYFLAQNSLRLLQKDINNCKRRYARTSIVARPIHMLAIWVREEMARKKARFDGQCVEAKRATGALHIDGGSYVRRSGWMAMRVRRPPLFFSRVDSPSRPLPSSEWI